MDVNLCVLSSPVLLAYLRLCRPSTNILCMTWHRIPVESKYSTGFPICLQSHCAKTFLGIHDTRPETWRKCHGKSCHFETEATMSPCKLLGAPKESFVTRTDLSWFPFFKYFPPEVAKLQSELATLTGNRMAIINTKNFRSSVNGLDWYLIVVTKLTDFHQEIVSSRFNCDCGWWRE